MNICNENEYNNQIQKLWDAKQLMNWNHHIKFCLTVFWSVLSLLIYNRIIQLETGCDRNHIFWLETGTESLVPVKRNNILKYRFWEPYMMYQVLVHTGTKIWNRNKKFKFCFRIDSNRNIVRFRYESWNCVLTILVSGSLKSLPVIPLYEVCTFGTFYNHNPMQREFLDWNTFLK